MPYAGEFFVDDTAAARLNRLEELRALGYRTPQRSIDELRHDAEPVTTSVTLERWEDDGLRA